MLTDGTTKALRCLSRDSRQPFETGGQAVRSVSGYAGTIWYILGIILFGRRVHGTFSFDTRYVASVSHSRGSRFLLGSSNICASNFGKMQHSNILTR